MLDASEHIGLLMHVIRQLGIPAYLADEAYSEGLVALTKAAKTFDEGKEVPPAAWIATYVKWELQNWRTREYKRQHSELSETLPAPQLPISIKVEQRMLLQEAIKASQRLEAGERLAIFGNAYGMNEAEVNQALKRLGYKLFGPEVEAFWRRARDKLANIIVALRVLRGESVVLEGEQKMAGNTKTKQAVQTGPKTRGNSNGATATEVKPLQLKPEDIERLNKAKNKTAEIVKIFPSATDEQRAAVLGGLNGAEPKANAAPKVAAKPAEKVACTGKTKAGTACTMPVIKGTNTCFNHMPDEYKEAHKKVAAKASA